MADMSITPVERLDFTIGSWHWAFADQRRGEIDAHFADLCARRAGVWNGRVLMMHRRALSQRVLSGAWFETGFADFIAWRDWGCPDASVTNCFAMGALRAADGAFVLGVMGPHTANAGRIYFAAGTPDPQDVADGRVDLAASVVREVEEETGLTEADYAQEADWHAVIAGPRIALMKLLDVPLPADAVCDRIRAHLARQDEPELADVRVARGPADFDDMMPEFVRAYLAHTWHNEGRSP